MPPDNGAENVQRDDIPLVAIGASAGGLEPLENFFNALTEHTDATFVIVQHLSPDYRSMMNEILSRRSSLPIRHIDDGMTLAPSTIYLNRPNMFVELENNTFRTFRYRDGDGLPHLPIDRLFQSLTGRDPNRTIGVIMSGSGTDGTRGAKALHDVGAAILVQSTNEAAFASMPRSVLLSGAVDRILNSGEMPPIIRDIFTYGKTGSVKSGEPVEKGLQLILRDLELHHNIDFNHYKPASVHRRIERRQFLRGHVDLDEYGEFLNENPEALDELFHDLLIGVTEFYRDPDAIKALRTKVLDKLAARADTSPLKVWIPGCASGEEAYTIAIELSEALTEAGKERRFRIIATDVHNRSIETASRGLYSEEKIENVPEHLREKYFVKANDKYLIDPALRQKIIFSVHNVLSDPPFMNLDLISCRNMLIYLNENPQASVISMFLFGLRKNGYLLLGASESVGSNSNAFETIDARWRIFRKVLGVRASESSGLIPRRGMGTSFAAANTDRHVVPGQRKPFVREVGELRSRETLMRSYNALLKRYAPSSILLTVDSKVLNWFGAAGTFIDTMNNLAEWTVQEIVHPDLHFAINVGVEKLRQGQFETHVRRIEVNLGDGNVKSCMVEVEPLDDGSDERLILAKIEILPDASEQARDQETADKAQKPNGSTQDGTVLTSRIHELERDLRLTEETLQHVTERLEASGEELQASNEELQASNEELQASNEELQSSNEELHAVNEELVSLSAEHERKIELLSELNQNTEIVLRVLNTGIILLDNQKRILRFSTLIERDFLLQAHDVERSIATVGPRLGFVDLEKMLDELAEKGTPLSAKGPHDGRDLSVDARQVQLGPTGGEITGAILVFRWL